MAIENKLFSDTGRDSDFALAVGDNYPFGQFLVVQLLA